MKKIMSIVLVVALLAMAGAGALADSGTEIEKAEPAAPFYELPKEAFMGGMLMVWIKKELSVPNRKWTAKDLNCESYAMAIYDLTACDDERVIKSYERNVNFRQILEIHLISQDKTLTLEAARKISESPYVYAVSYNAYYKTLMLRKFDLSNLNYGDANGDGKVNAADALAVLKDAVNKQKIQDPQIRILCDMDKDGLLSAADALLILKKAVAKC